MLNTELIHAEDAASPTAVLHALPKWYTLMCSGGFRRAVANRVSEQTRLSQQFPWLLSHSNRSNSPEATLSRSATPKRQQSSFIVPPPSSLRTMGGVPIDSNRSNSSRFEQLCGLKGDGTYASERLTASEAQFRGLAPQSSYASSGKSGGSVITAYCSEKRPSSAAPKMGGRKYLHIDGKSKRSPVVLIGPSYKAKTADVIDATAAMLAPSAAHSGHRRRGTSTSPDFSNVQSKLSSVPVRNTQYNTARRDLLMEKASAIANVVASGGLYISPLTGERAAAVNQHIGSAVSSSPSVFRQWHTQQTNAPALCVNGVGSAPLRASGAPLISNAHEVFALLSATADDVCTTMASSTATLLVAPLLNDLRVDIERFANVTSSNEVSDMNIEPHTDSVSPADNDKSPSFTITGAKSNDCLIPLARKEVWFLNAPKGIHKRSPVADDEVPVVSGTCLVLSLRSALAFGVNSVSSKNGLRDDMINIMEGRGGSNNSQNALSFTLSWLWSCLRWCDDQLNALYLPVPLRSKVLAGATSIDKAEYEVQRTRSVSSALVEAVAILAYDELCRGGGDGGANDVTVASAAAMAHHASVPIPSRVQQFAEAAHGYIDKRFVFINSTRVGFALHDVLGAMLGNNDDHTTVSSPVASPQAKSPPQAALGGGGAILDSGTELIDDYDSNGLPSNAVAVLTPPLAPAETLPLNSSCLSTGVSQPRLIGHKQGDNSLAFLILVLMSRVSLHDIICVAAGLMAPLWATMVQRRDQNHTSGVDGGYAPPSITLRTVEHAEHAALVTRVSSPPRPQTANLRGVTSSPSKPRPATAGASSLRTAHRPVSASSLKRLTENPYRNASVVADEGLAAQQREDELASPLPRVGVTRRDPLTRVNKDEYNLERVLMSRLSRRLLNVALEGADMGDQTGAMPSNEEVVVPQRPQTPTQPSNLTKLLNDLHARPVAAAASSPLMGNSVQSAPNRLGLGGSVRNNVMPPFMKSVENPTTYRTMRAYHEPGEEGRNRIDSHFVQYLQKGIISEPYRQQLAHANPHAMSTLQRAALMSAEGLVLDADGASGAPSDAALHHFHKNNKSEATALTKVLRDPSFTVSTPLNGYMNPTRLQSATRQQQFQHIEAHLMNIVDASSPPVHVASEGSRPSSGIPRSTIIVDGSGRPSSSSVRRPTSGNFFSRVPSGYGTSVSASSLEAHPHHAVATRVVSGSLVEIASAHGGTTPQSVVLGSNLGETPNEIQRVSTPQSSRPVSPIHAALVTSKESSDRASGAPTSTACGRVHSHSANGQVINNPNSVRSGPRTTAPSIPSPTRRRFGLPVRDIDRVIAAREMAAAYDNVDTSAVASSSPLSGAKADTTLATTFGNGRVTTKRAQPRVSMGSTALTLTDAAIVPKMTSPPMQRLTASPSKYVLSHRPISSLNQDGDSKANGPILLVPQMAALPVTNGGSFSQRLSSGLLTSTTRSKKF